MEDKKILLDNIDKVHTTEMGIDRIKRNLKIDTADVVEYCKNKRYALYTKVKRRLRNTAEWSYRMSVPPQYVRQWKSRKEKGDVGDI